MSQYPFGYPFQGQPPQQSQEQQQQFNSQWQPYNAYHPTATTTSGYQAQPTPNLQQPAQPQYPTAPANPYYSSQPSFDFNATHIPGLGTPPTGPPFPTPAAFAGAWHQAPAAYGANPQQAQYSAHGLPNASQPPPYAYPNYQEPVSATASAQKSGTKTATRAERARPNKKHASVSKGQGKVKGKQQQKNQQQQQKAQPQQKTQQQQKAQQQQKPPQIKEQPKVIAAKASAKEVESQDEGEISDGYFDDLYDDTPNQTSITVTKDPVTLAAKTSGGEDATVDNSDQEPNFYDTDKEDTSGANASAPTAPQKPSSEVVARGRSRSYSPHLSPAEIQRDSSPRAQVSRPSIANPNSSSTAPVGAGAQGVGSSGTDVNSTKAAPHSFATVSEAQNEAKKAILRLLPHGVKYQTYIDEGLDEKVVKGLFAQLNLPTEPALAVSSEKSVPVQEKQKQESSKATLQTESSQTDDVAKTQEERKDRIARLLAEKKAKALMGASGSGVPPAEPNNGTPVVSEAAPAKPKVPTTRAEKDLLLQQKMEALRKKAASKQTASTPASTPEVGASLTAQTTSVNPSPTVGTPTPTTVLRPAPVHKPPSNPATPQSSSFAAPIAALPSLLSSRPQQQINQRKRPTAADFMDFPPAGIKRPSLANRQNSSLVISVSDDEGEEEDDDDEDVEMEVDSGTEESPAPPQASLSVVGRKGPSIRDFPPLTNKGTSRNLSSPLNGTSTPVNKAGQVDLQAKEEQIAKMRRQIEEMEARRASAKKGSSTPHTPSTGAVTPTAVSTLLASVAAEPIPKTTEQRQPTPVQGSTHRASSAAPVSGKSAKALEKAERLRRMQEEMLRLQAEIEEDEAEEEQLASENAAAAAAVVDESVVSANSEEAVVQSTTEAWNDADQSLAMEIDEDESMLQPFVPDSTASDGYEPPEAAGQADDSKIDDENSTIVSKPTEQTELNSQVKVPDSFETDRHLTNEKADHESAAARQTSSSYTPYESPLRSFRSYRFHPHYGADVAGGLKSLTYSNRIDPKKEMCPDEWEGNDCPRGEACMFQHFQNIIAPDSEIILELGSSDGLPDKQQFNNGLREVVSSFQKSKMKDFRTIAQAIIDYRREYLGDDSKVLPLEGTSL